MNIAIIGLGLIGGSLGRAIVKKTEHQVFGRDIDPSVMLRAELLQAFHKELNETNRSEIDLVLIALRPNATIEELKKIVPNLKKGAIIMDCCGTKRKVVAVMKELAKDYPDLVFIGGHPMAGREFSGIGHSTAGLFDRASMIITPVAAPLEALSAVKTLFAEIGFAGTVITTANRHDKIIAYTSQLAHIVSSAYVKSPVHAEHAGFSAGSFRDLTRVAKLDPEMWAELFLENKDNLLEEIDVLLANLNAYRDALAEDNEWKLKALLAQGVVCKEAAENQRKERVYE